MKLFYFNYILVVRLLIKVNDWNRKFLEFLPPILLKVLPKFLDNFGQVWKG